MERSRPRHSRSRDAECRAAGAALERVIHCRKYDLVRLARYSTSTEIVFPAGGLKLTAAPWAQRAILSLDGFARVGIFTN